MPGRPPLRAILATALRLRCPHCGKGSLFRGWPNRLWPKCPVCGLSFFREPGYYLGGMILTYVFAAFVLVAAYLLSFLSPRARQVSATAGHFLWPVLAIVLTFLFVRPAYSLWLSLDFWISPWTPGDKR